MGGKEGGGGKQMKNMRKGRIKKRKKQVLTKGIKGKIVEVAKKTKANVEERMKI